MIRSLTRLYSKWCSLTKYDFFHLWCNHEQAESGDTSAQHKLTMQVFMHLNYENQHDNTRWQLSNKIRYFQNHWTKYLWIKYSFWYTFVNKGKINIYYDKHSLVKENFLLNMLCSFVIILVEWQYFHENHQLSKHT